MPLPAMLTFNELNGDEVAHILTNRFDQVIGNVPYFKPHLTLPRVRMTMRIELQVWADQPSPETLTLSDQVTVVFDEPKLIETITAESVDSTAPGGGKPPDEVREMHGIPVTRPSRGPREIGGQVAISDQQEEVEGPPGLTVSRTAGARGDVPYAVVAKIDQGPAGLRQKQMNRDRWQFGGKAPGSDR